VRERRERERERNREEAPLALRGTRPHAVGFTGECDQKQGVIEWPCRTVQPVFGCTRVRASGFGFCVEIAVLIPVSIYDKRLVGPSIRTICTR